MLAAGEVETWLLLIGLAVAALLAATVVRAIQCEAGWRAWVCYQLACLEGWLFFGWRSENPCPYPEQGPAIIVANHTSPADPVILWIRHFVAFRRPHLRVIGYMTAAEYCERGGAVGWVCRAMESIPVTRSGRDMGPARAALQRLREGRLTGVFPEGRLNNQTPETRLLRADTGVAWLALKSGAPVIPVFIRNAPRSTSMVRCFLKRTQTTVVYGRPLDLSPWHERRPGHQTLNEVTDHIMASIAELGGIEFTPTTADPAELQGSDHPPGNSDSADR